MFILHYKHGILWTIVTLFVENIKNITLERTKRNSRYTLYSIPIQISILK